MQETQFTQVGRISDEPSSATLVIGLRSLRRGGRAGGGAEGGREGGGGGKWGRWRREDGKEG